MKLSVKFRVLINTLAVAAMAGTLPVAAREYPQHPIKIVVPFAAGGGTDILGRLLAKSLTDALEGTVIVENVAGASGTIGAAKAAMAPADGYTLFLGASVTNAIAPSLFKVNYDPIKDFESIAQIATFGNPLIVNSKIPVHNIAELVDWSKNNKNGGSYSTWGIGSVPHLAMEFINKKMSASLVHVPYKGAILALNAVIANEVPIGFSDPLAVIPFYKSGRVRIIAVTGSKRAANMPEVPTLTEQGIPLSTDSWYGLFAPAGVPENVLAKLRETMAKISATEEFKRSIADLGMMPSIVNTAEFDKVRREDLITWTELVKLSGAAPNK